MTSRDRDRVWSKVCQADDDSCWEWTAARNGKGYGQVGIAGSMRFAHRVIYELTHGAIPDGLCVCHACDNPPCCNPSHLWLGTHADNAADRDRKHRRQPPIGVRNGRAKLTPAQVEQIRARYARGEETQRELGDEYGVVNSTISRITRDAGWTEAL